MSNRWHEPEITPELAAQHGLTGAEYQTLQDMLGGRLPTYTELGVFSVMWSEHCSYKSSRSHLKNLPTKGPQVIQGPGENAGVVDIGDGQAVVFKMESHNHPSFIEPHQGAATGVGGICRDIFTMGARPIALADCLRFGRIDHPRTKDLVYGVVSGIASYGNSFGVPNVAGDVSFDSCYDGNNLVNAFCLGLAPADKIFLGKAAGVGNPVLYVGAKTGRDGIHGATMASAEFGEDAAEKRPTVQVGDPFMEKLLLEACLELMQTDYLVGIQDMGAAGLSCSSIEMAANADTGVKIWLDKVPRRETNMTPYELMLSESQERMLLVVEKGRQDDALAIFEKWDLDCAVVGEVTDTGRVIATMDGRLVCDLPAKALADGAVYDRPMARPAYLDEAWASASQATPAPVDLRQAWLAIVSSPNIASKHWVTRQYDQNVRHGTVLRPGSADAGVVRVPTPDGKRQKGVAIAADCNARFVYLDPYEGGKLTVAEAAANVAATGARPLATTDCLNFGNPEKPEIMWQFAEALRGIGEACVAFSTPIVSGNVSFYNETDGKAIFPTPMIGMVGLLDDVSHRVVQFFRRPGETVALFGENTDELGGSEFLKVVHNKVAGRPPRLSLDRAKAGFALMVALAQDGLLSSAHDVSDGGLAACLTECCVSGPELVGAELSFADDLALHLLLFAEAPSRYVVSFAPEYQEKIATLADKHNVPFSVLGKTGGDCLAIEAHGQSVDLSISELSSAWRNGFDLVVKC